MIMMTVNGIGWNSSPFGINNIAVFAYKCLFIHTVWYGDWGVGLLHPISNLFSVEML